MSHGGSVLSAETSGMPTVEAIRTRGLLRVVVNSYTPGLAYRVSDDEGGYSGLEIDLVRGLASELFSTAEMIDDHIEFVEASNEDKINLLVEKEVDLVVANLYDTESRRKLIDFGGHYLTQRYAPLLGVDCPEVRDPADLTGLRVAVEAGSTDEEALVRTAPGADVIPMRRPEDWLRALEQGDVEAFWSDTTYGPATARTSESGTRIGILRAGIEYSAVGIHRDAEDLRRFVDDYVGRLAASGELLESFRRWGISG